MTPGKGGKNSKERGKGQSNVKSPGTAGTEKRADTGVNAEGEHLFFTYSMNRQRVFGETGARDGSAWFVALPEAGREPRLPCLLAQ